MATVTTITTYVESLNISTEVLASTTTKPWTFDDPVQRRIVAAMLIVVGLLGLVGNAIVIFAFALSERLQNITNVFVINLAVSDFLSSAIVPFFVQNILTENDNLLPEKLCALVGIMLYVFVSSSIVNHAVIAINRYCSISRPVPLYRKLFSPFRITVMLAFIWIYSSIIPFVTHLTKITEFGYNSKYRICSLDIVKPNALVVSFVRVVAVDIVCLIIVVIFYFKIFLFIKKHSNELMHLYSTERKVSDSSSLQRSSTCTVVEYPGPMERTASTVTRIVNVDDIDPVKKPKPIWRQMTRSVSETVLHVNGVVNEGCVDDGEKDQADDKGKDEDGELRGKSAIPVASRGSKIVESNLNAISENHEVSQISERRDNDDNSPSASRKSVDESESDDSVQNDREYNGGTTDNVNDNENFSSSSSNTPKNSPLASKRRRISQLVQRSFFGRESSASSTSERVRCMQVRLNRRQIKITKNLFVVVCAYVICVSQYAVFLIIPVFERLLPYSAVLITFSHAVNPLIYALKHPTFKVVIRPMLMCQFSKIPGPSKFLKFILRK